MNITLCPNKRHCLSHFSPTCKTKNSCWEDQLAWLKSKLKSQDAAVLISPCPQSTRSKPRANRPLVGNTSNFCRKLVKPHFWRLLWLPNIKRIKKQAVLSCRQRRTWSHQWWSDAMRFSMAKAKWSIQRTTLLSLLQAAFKQMLSPQLSGTQTAQKTWRRQPAINQSNKMPVQSNFTKAPYLSHSKIKTHQTPALPAKA